MRTIVIGVDGSERSSDALALARRLAERATQLVLVCAYPADRQYVGDGGPAYARALRAGADAALARLGGEIGSETLAIADSRPARALQEVAAERGASLVVVGSSHRGPLRRVLPGGTARHLLHGTSCPIAIAPRDFRKRADDRLDVVACAYDDTPESRRALACSVELAERLGASIRLLRVTDPPTAVDAILTVDEQAAAAAKRIRTHAAHELHGVVGELEPELRAEAVMLCGDPAEELVRASSSVDLMVVGSRGYGPLRGVLLGSVSGRVVSAAACPVIVVPRTSRADHAASRSAASSRRSARSSSAHSSILRT